MTPSSFRLIFLDNLRSFALLLGLVFHAAIVYAECIGYALKSVERSTVLDDFCFFVHSFRMPLFFFLSGYFSEMVWEKKGFYVYWKTRANRLLIPFVTGVLLFAPVQYYLVELQSGEILVSEFLWEYWLGRKYGVSHLWFLYYLVLYCVILIFIPGKNKFFRFPNQNNGSFLFLFVSLTLGATLFSHSFFPKGWKLVGIDMYLFLFYFTFFFSGILAYTNKAIFHETTIGRRYKLIIFLASLFFFAIFEFYERTDPLWMGYFWGGGIKRLIHISLSSVTAWIFIYFFIEFFKRFFNFENPFTVYLRESSLPIYLIHHPISLVTGYLLLDSNLGVYQKFILHTVVVFIFSFLVYDSFVKSSPLWRRLLGMKID